MQSERKSNLIEIYTVLLVDLVVVALAYLLAMWIRFGDAADIAHRETHLTVMAWMFVFTILYNVLVGAGRNFLKRGYFVEFKSVFKHIACMGIFLVLALFVWKEAENFSRLVFGYFLVAEFILMLSAHALLKKGLRARRKIDRGRSKIMLIVHADEAELFIKTLAAETRYDCEITGLALWENGAGRDAVSDIPVIVSAADEAAIVESLRTMAIDEVFIHLPDVEKSVIGTLITEIETMGISCHYHIGIMESEGHTGRLDDFGGFPVITYEIHTPDQRRNMIKRLIDIVGALVGLLITAIAYIFVGIAIKLDSPGPVVFSQVRIGKNGRRFKIYKFRSMYIDAEARKKELVAQNEMQGLMFKMEDDPRVTRVGRFIRKTSIDELPQFWNVLKGDMSLVGTRPPTEDEFEKYTPYYRRRLCMTPGLTGLWQVSGRSNVDNFDDVVKYDLHYIDHWSLSLDMKILFQTVFVVLFGKGAK